MEESHKTHRPHIKVGKDEEKKKKEGVGMRKGEEGMEGEEWRREGGTEGRREVRM